MNKDEIRRYLNVIKRAVQLIEGMLDSNDDGLLEKLVDDLKVEPSQPVSQPVPVVPVQPVVLPPPVVHPPVEDEQIRHHREARKKHISDLMAIDCWPETVPAFLIGKTVSDEDQVNRSNSVLDFMLDRTIDGARFLDFGCGDGWIARQAIQRGAIEATGYDIEFQKNWNKLAAPNIHYTSVFGELKRSYYDIVFLYDVLDHCEDPLLVMNQVKQCIRPEGTVHIRCHPWTSKHANHIYKQGINKAYLHLFLNWDELTELIGQNPIFTRMEKRPLEAYRWWLHDFDIKKEHFIKEPVNEFFKVPAFKQLLASEQQIPIQEIDEFLFNLEIQFVDFICTPKK